MRSATPSRINKLSNGPTESKNVRLDLLLAAKAHHALDAGAVVPGAIEDDELLARGQEPDEALEIPFGVLAARGLARRVDSRLARAHMLGQPLDRAILARAVAALEHDQHPRAVGDELALQLHQLDLQIAQLAPVVMIVLVVVVMLLGHQINLPAAQPCVQRILPL